MSALVLWILIASACGNEQPNATFDFRLCNETTKNVEPVHFFPYPSERLYYPINQTVSISIPRNVSSVTIGGLFGITDPWGELDVKGMLEAATFISTVLQINRNPVLLPYTKLEYIVVNHEKTDQLLISSAFALFFREVVSVIGLTTKSEIRMVQPVFETSDIPMVSGSATFSTYPQPSYSTFLQTIPNDYDVAHSISSMCRTMGWTAVSYITPLNATVYELASSLNENGITVMCKRGQLLIDDPQTVDEFSECVARSPSQIVIFWGGTFEEYQNWAVKIKLNPSNKDVVILFAYEDHGVESLGETVQEMGNSLSFGLGSPNVERFREIFALLTPQFIDNLEFFRFWERTFKCSLYGSPHLNNRENMANRVIHVAGLGSPAIGSLGSSFMVPVDHPPCPDDMSLRNDTISCQCTGRENLGNTAGPFPYTLEYIRDAVMSVATAIDQLVNQCTSLAEINPYMCGKENFTARDLLLAIQESNFEGWTGNIQFIGNYRLGGTIEIHQYHQQIEKWVLVGNHTLLGTRLDPKVLRFEGGVPVSQLDPVGFDLDDPAVAVFFSINVALLTCVVVLGIFLAFKRNHPVIIQTGLEFLLFIHVGSMLMCMGQIIPTIKLNTATCLLKRLFWIFGLVVFRGSLAAKVAVSLLVLYGLRFRKMRMLRLCMSVFCLVPIIFYLAFIIGVYSVNGYPTPTLLRSNKGSFSFHIDCSTRSGNVKKYLVMPYAWEFVINTIWALLALIAISVQSPNEENIFIALAMSNLTVITGLFLPIYNSLEDSSQEFIFLSVILTYLTLSIYGIIVIPKLVVMYRATRPESDGRVRGYKSFLPSESSFPIN